MDSLKEICEAMLLRDIGEDTVLLYLGVAEQYTVHRLKVRKPYSLSSLRLLCDAVCRTGIFSKVRQHRAPVAQWVEHRAAMQEVVSSTPAGPTLRVFK